MGLIKPRKNTGGEVIVKEHSIYECIEKATNANIKVGITYISPTQHEAELTLFDDNGDLLGIWDVSTTTTEFGDATPNDVVKGKEFTSNEGIRLIGTHECGGKFTKVVIGHGEAETVQLDPAKTYMVSTVYDYSADFIGFFGEVKNGVMTVIQTMNHYCANVSLDEDCILTCAIGDRTYPAYTIIVEV